MSRMSTGATYLRDRKPGCVPLCARAEPHPVAGFAVQKRAGFMTPSLRSRAGFTTPSLGSRAGFTTPSLGSRAGFTTPSLGSRAGFTLIELLAVLVILSILMVVLIPRLADVGELAKSKLTRQFMSQLDAAISEYENRFGDFPPSQYQEKWGSPPNSTNMGAETLVLALWSPEWGGTNLPEDKLVNTDGDETKKALARFPKTSLFELKDSWDNPIAYFHRRDYGRQDMYVLVNPDTGETTDSAVTARKNATTGNFHNPNKCQLLSAGPDGEFGTEDDIANFEDAN